jgi:pilus assembly protein CpaE
LVETPAGPPAGASAEKIRVVVVDDTPRTVANLKRLLSFEPDIEVVGTGLNAGAGLDLARRQHPDVLVMDVNLPDMDGIRATEQLGHELPMLPVILISVQEDREYLNRAMKAGARQYLVKPFSADDLVEAIRRVHQTEVARRQRSQPALEVPALIDAAVVDRAAVEAPAVELETEPVEAPPEPEPPPRRRETGTVVCVFSGKGGVGKSTIAVNLAVELGRVSGEDVALVDLDLQFGDVAVMLGLEPPGTMADVVQAYPNIDGPFIGTLMPEAAGIRVLAAPLSPELADLVTPEHVRAALDLLRQAFDFVVVDMTQHLNDVTLEAFEACDKVILVTDLNLPAIKDAKLAFRVFEHLGFPRDKILLVLNRADAPSDINVGELEANLNFPVSVRIPSQGKIVVTSIQRSIPFVVAEPNAQITQTIRDLVGTLLPFSSAERTGARGAGRRRFWTR